MIIEKGKFSITINKIGGVNISYRKFTFEIGFFTTDLEIPLFRFHFLNWHKEANLFQIFAIKILWFEININIHGSRWI